MHLYKCTYIIYIILSSVEELLDPFYVKVRPPSNSVWGTRETEEIEAYKYIHK